jgi:hypothetical protein
VHDAAKALNDTGATVFAVTLSKDYYLPELEIYAGSKDRVYTDDKANNFLADIGKLTNGPGNCPTPATTPAPTTQPTTTQASVLRITKFNPLAIVTGCNGGGRVVV